MSADARAEHENLRRGTIEPSADGRGGRGTGGPTRTEDPALPGVCYPQRHPLQTDAAPGQ